MDETEKFAGCVVGLIGGPIYIALMLIALAGGLIAGAVVSVYRGFANYFRSLKSSFRS